MGVGILTREEKEINRQIQYYKGRQRFYFKKWHELDIKINILKHKKMVIKNDNIKK